MSSRYDLAVIGAGSAGFWVAIAAAELGARVALIGHGTIGGTCVNISCMPSKNLIRATEALYHANNGQIVSAAHRSLTLRVLPRSLTRSPARDSRLAWSLR